MEWVLKRLPVNLEVGMGGAVLEEEDLLLTAFLEDDDAADLD